MINNSIWLLRGALANETALSILMQGQQKMTHASAHTALVIDLTHIDSIDSAGVAVLLEWQRFACQQHKKLILTGAPAKLLAMVHLYELDGVLSFTEYAPVGR